MNITYFFKSFSIKAIQNKYLKSETSNLFMVMSFFGVHFNF